MKKMLAKNPGIGLFLILYQLFVITTLPFYLILGSPTWAMFSVSVALYFLGGLAITGGYHRYFSHRSYKTNRVIEAVVLFFGSITLQGSVLRWSYDHRLHHAHVDTDDDPYSIKKGFWYAHFLWLLDKPRPIDKKVVADLMSNPLVMFQHKYDKFCMIGSNVLLFFLVGWLMNDYIGAFFLATWARIFALHHCTWFINSLAHTWGDKPFCKEQSAVNNYIISLLTFGEGYHNYHHTYANDYRNGIRWYQYDPTKWLIWLLSKLGLATNLRRVDPLTVKKKMVLEGKNDLMAKVTSLWYVKREELEAIIQDISNRIVEKIAQFNELKAQYRSMKKNSAERFKLKELRRELKELKRSIRDDWRRWCRLCRQIYHLKPLQI
jgi:stearoyl-CoA desaturase (Delta-9 desaturase)